jgi:protein TonB
LPVKNRMVDTVREASSRTRTSARCDSCGGPAETGHLCAACEQAFHTLLDAGTLTPHSSEIASHSPDEAVAAAPATTNTLMAWLDSANRHPSAEQDEPEEPWALTALVASELERWPQPQTGIGDRDETIPDHRAQLRLPFEPLEAVPEEIEDVPVVATLRRAFEKKDDAPAAPPVPDDAPAKSPRVLSPVFTRKAEAAPESSRSALRGIATAAAAVVVVAAIGFPLFSKLRGADTASQPGAVASGPGPSASPKPAPGATQTAQGSAAAAAAPDAPAAPARRDSAATPEPASAATNPRPGAQPTRPAARSRTGAKPGPQKIVLPAPRPPVETGPPAAVAATISAVAAEPVPAPSREPVAPVGPFFEVRDVSAAPQIVSRVEPSVPADIAGPVNEIVVVRVLVSHIGQPSLVRLLRASRTGPVLDDAVISAVKQWRFVPAQRRGAAVSCWYHVGVPVRRTE